MKKLDPKDAFGCTLGALRAGPESKPEILAKRILDRAVTIRQHRGLDQFHTHILGEGSI